MIAPERLRELPEETRKILAGLREEELQTLVYLVSLPKADAERTIEFVREIRIAGKWIRWIIAGALAVFLGTLAFFDGIAKFTAMLRGNQ